MQNHLFLLGFMGCGKSYWGPQLAERLALPFVDLDDRIETGEGRSISTIFEQSGETGFRLLEQQYLQTLGDEKPAVVATGGGTPCYSGNFKWMQEHGLTLYLKTPVAVLASRLRLDREMRPILKGVSEHQLEAYIEALLEKREPYYNRSDLIARYLDNNAAFLEQIISDIRHVK